MVVAVYPEAIFATNNDEDNRATIADVPSAGLVLAGIAVRGDKKDVDRVVRGATSTTDGAPGGGTHGADLPVQVLRLRLRRGGPAGAGRERRPVADGRSRSTEEAAARGVVA
ncbi:DUF2000 family protein [Kitasatospora sp. NPDC058218]|uniref:DUF2000 family protein n=1 Tax=Kitasatospora sp. NPDC058218 TaxID=3346385 RepID=UPI0036D91E19